MRDGRKQANGEDREAGARESSLFVGSLEKGLQILSVFDRERRAMGLSEIVAASGLDKSSVQRFTFTLHALGFLRKDEGSRRYALSPRVLELGFAYLQSDSLIEFATPLLYEANRATGESFNITELVDTEVVYVARVPGRHVISVDILLGMRLPAYACAPGRAILAFLDEAQAERVLAASELRRFTPKTVVAKAQLRRELATAREAGYAVAEEQCYLGEISIAAPIFGPGGEPVAALNASLPVSRWSADRVRAELAPIVVDKARLISQGQGAAASHPWYHRFSSDRIRRRATSPRRS